MDFEQLKRNATNGNSGAALLLGWKTAFDDGKPEEGMQILKDGLKDTPDNPNLTSALAGCYLIGEEKDGDSTEEALKLLSSVMEKLYATYEDGFAVSLDEMGDKECIDWYTSSADKGNISAALTLAEAYKDGKYVEQNHDMYMQYLGRASGLGDLGARVEFAEELVSTNEDLPVIRHGLNILTEISGLTRPRYAVKSACRILSGLYLEGKKVAKDEAKAVEYAVKMADAGDTGGLMELAGAYYAGERGAEVNRAKALELYECAGNRGNRDAMETVGRMLYKGDGIASDPQKAVEWYMKAARKGSYDSLEMAEKLLGMIYPSQAEKIYVKMLKDMEEDGYYAAFVKLYHMHREGRGLPKDTEAARNYLERAVKGGYPYACAEYGGLLREGDAELGIGQDKALAVEMWEKAASRDYAPTFLCLGKAYMDGEGVPADTDKAEVYLDKAKTAGIGQADIALGDLYLKEEYGRHDPDKTFQHYEQAYSNGITDRLCALGQMYETMEGRKNLAKALEAYRKSADLGEAEGILCYGRLMCEASLNMREGFDYNSFKEGSGYLLRALSMGHPDAMKILLDNYRADMELNSGYDDPKSENYRFRRDEFNFLLKNGSSGDADLKSFIADCFFNGRCDTNDRERGFWWLERAAEGGSLDAKRTLVKIRYGSPESPSADYNKAEKMLKEIIAASEGDTRTNAMHDLALLYFKTIGSEEEAAKWFMKAAELGHSAAEYNLGLCYYYGKGISQDRKKARAWLERAYEHGNEDAEGTIKKLFGSVGVLAAQVGCADADTGTGGWKCQRCGAVNSIGKGMCPKCGTVRGYY